MQRNIIVGIWVSAMVSIFSGGFSNINAQETLPIYEIQGKGNVSPHEGERVITEGVVTLTLFASGQLGGFFIQDTLGDADITTSDGIFVYGKADVKQGDYVRLSALVGEYNGRTQLSGFTDLQTLGQNIKIPYTHYVFPEQFPDKESIEGMAIAFSQKLYISSTSSLGKYGELILSSKMLRAPTDAAYPKSEEYYNLLAWNAIDQIMLDDGSSSLNPNPKPFLDKNGTCRTNNCIDSLYGVWDQITTSLYAIYSVSELNFYGNPRTEGPNEAALGDYNLKACGFNVENFLNKSDLQKRRIIKAMAAINADLYGICEVQEGENIIKALCDALNAYMKTDLYTYIPWVNKSSSYTVTHILYRKDKLSPVKDFNMLNSYPGVKGRRLSQGFTHKESGTRFIFSINHLKAKSGNPTGDNVDQGDGQGIFNYQRIQEAKSVVAKLNELVYYYGTNNILCMGDLNAFAKEDPIVVFNEAGYYNQTERFSDSSYSYHFGNYVEYLDYSLANDSMARYITGSIVWHINADEPSFLDYEQSAQSDDFPYRSSDHDPVVVGIHFKKSASNMSQLKSTDLKLYPMPCREELRWYASLPIQRWEILDMQGKLVESGNGGGYSRGEIDVQSLDKGMYLFKGYNEQGVYVKKIIKQ